MGRCQTEKQAPKPLRKNNNSKQSFQKPPARFYSTGPPLNLGDPVGCALYPLFSYQIIVADAADAVSVNFFGRCKFLQIYREKLAFFGVNFILQKFCSCKKMTNIRYELVLLHI